MIFDIQRFASVTINPGQTYVTATTTEQAYTLSTTSAKPQVDVDSLSEEIQALIATGTATGTVGDVTVAIDAEGNITAPEGTDLAGLIGQTVSIVGEVGEQTATIGNATTITASTEEGTAAAGEYTLRADATYTTYFTVTVDESGAVTSVSYFDGTTTQTTSTSVIAGQTLYGEVPDPTTGDATAGVDNAYAAATAINRIASDTNTANLTYSAENGTVSYQKGGEAIGDTFNVTNYSDYTATAAGYKMTFDADGKLTAVEGGTLTEDGTGFTVEGSTDTYTVTATAGDGTLSGTLTTPAGAAIPVEFTATASINTVAFDLDNNGEADLNVIFTDGKPESDTYTVNNITYTVSAGSDTTYLATSTQGAAVSATTEVAATTGLGTESTATGTTTTSTLYSGTATASFTVGTDYSHELSVSFSSGNITGVTDTYQNTTTALTETDGAYAIGTTGLSVKFASDALADGTLVASEITVSTTWNNGSDVGLHDTITGTASALDGIQVNANSGGNVIKFAFDDTHMYAFVVDSKGKLINYGDTETNGEDEKTIGGITFASDKTIAFSSDGGSSWIGVSAQVSTSGTVAGIETVDEKGIKGFTVKYSSNDDEFTITPDSAAIFTVQGERISTLTFATSDGDDGTVYTGAQLALSGTKASTFANGNGKIGFEFTTPTFSTGVSSSNEKYGITFDSMTLGSSGKNTFWNGNVTITAGTSTVAFGTANLTAWSAAVNGSAYLGTSGSTSTSGSYTWALGTGNSIVFATASGTDYTTFLGTYAGKWYKSTVSYGTSASSNVAVQLSTGTGTTYTGALLVLDTANDKLSYKSTALLGTSVKATDQLVTFDLAKGSANVYNALAYDANSTDGIKIAKADGLTTTATTGGDKIVGTLDSYTLNTTNNTSKAWSMTFGTSLKGFEDFVAKLGAVGGSGSTATAKANTLTTIDLSNATSASDTTTFGTTGTSHTFGTYKLDENITMTLDLDGTSTSNDISFTFKRVALDSHANKASDTNAAEWLSKAPLSVGGENYYYTVVGKAGAESATDVGLTTSSFNAASDTASAATIKFGTIASADPGANIATVVKIGGKEYVFPFAKGWSAVIDGNSSKYSSSKGAVVSNFSNYEVATDNGLHAVKNDGVHLFTNTGTTLANAYKSGKGGLVISDSTKAYALVDTSHFKDAGIVAVEDFGTDGVDSNLASTNDKVTVLIGKNTTGYTKDGVGGTSWMDVADAFATEVKTALTLKFDEFTALNKSLGSSTGVAATWTDVTKVLTNVSLGGTGTYTIALSDTGIVAAAYDADGTGTASAATEVTVTNGAFTDTTSGIAYKLGTDGNLVVSSITNSATSLTLDVSKQNVGELDHIELALSNGKVSGVTYYNAKGSKLSADDYDIWTSANTRVKESTADTIVAADTVIGGSSATLTDEIAWITAGGDVSVMAAAGGTTNISLGDLATTFQSSVNEGNNLSLAYSASDTVNTANINAGSLSDEDIKAAYDADVYQTAGVTGTLRDATLANGSTIIKLTFGGEAFYLVTTATLGSSDSNKEITLKSTDKLYNAAGVEITDSGEGLYLNGGSLYVSNDNSADVKLTVKYTAANTDSGVAESFAITGAVSSNNSKYATKVVIEDLTAETIAEVSGSVLERAALLGYEDDTAYSTVTKAKSATPTSAATAQARVVATYLTGKYASEGDWSTAEKGGAAGVEYSVSTADGGYTGLISLGFTNVDADATYAPVVNESGTVVQQLYATYTYDSAKKFTITGIYSDSAATTKYEDAVASETSITFGSGDTAITYTLSASSYSDVTIALTSGTITYDNATISLTSASITNTAAGTATSDTTFVLSEGISYTVNTETKTMTLTMGTATFTESMDSNNTAGYDSTETGYRYTATWNDTTGDGVTTDDTITVVTTALSDTTKLTATAAVTLDGTSYNLTASETGTVTVTDASGTTVDAATLGYTFALVDADSSTTVTEGDYFTYTSTTGDTVSGTTVASTETGTLGDVTGVVRYSAISTDGTTTYTFASDATVTAAAEFVINGVTYTANSDGTVSRKATEAESVALEQTGVTSDTTTYTLAYDSTTSQIVLTNTKTGASEVTAVTLASEAYITGVDGSKIMIDDAWTQEDDGTYTLTSGNTTYTYTPADEDAGTAATCTYITINDPTAYTFSENEGSEPTLLAADGSVLSGTFSGTYTTVADGAEIAFEGLTTEELIAQITAAVGEDALADVTVTVTGGEATLGTATIGGETSTTNILYNGNVIATIVDNTAVVNGTTLTFEADGTGTYTTVTSADGVETYLDEEGNLIVGGGNAATIASLDEETGFWTLTEDVDNITNTTGEELAFTAADGDTGYLSNGDAWDIVNNTLTPTNQADQETAIKDNEGTIHTSDGIVTGANEDAFATYASYTTVTEVPELYESAAYIFGVNSSSSVEGTEIEGVVGDDNFNIAIRDGSIVAYDDISEDATITSAANGTDIYTDEDGATVTLADGFAGTVNGAEVAVSDEDGVQLTASDDDGIDLISGVSDGASVTAPEGTTFSTDSVAAGEVANFNINGEDLALKGEDDGIIVDGNEVSGLDEGAILGGDGVYTVNGTEVALDDDTSVRGGADGTAEEYTADDAADDLADSTAYQKVAEPATLKDLIADGVLTAAEIASLDADNITLTDSLLGNLSGVRVAAVDGVKIVDESKGNNTIAAGNNGMVRIAKDATGNKVVDASAATTGAILASNSDNANVTLTGGAGNDTMIASANDVVNLSNGADVVTLRGAGSSTIAGTGVSDASLEVTGFEGGFLTDADALNVNIASFNATDDGKQLVLGSGAKVNIKGTAAAASTAASLTATDYSGDIDNASYAVFGVKNGTDRVALINEATSYQVASTWSLTDNTTSANSFLGEGTVKTTPTNNVAVDFGAITSGSVTPDLEKSFTENTATFRNVQGIAGAAANTTLIGSNTGANEFKAGSGATTIIGGLNTADTIYGNGGEAGAVIFHNDDQGKDIVGDFSSKDAIWTPNLSGVEVDGSDVKVFSLVTDSEGNQVRGENALTLKDAAATSNPFQIITGVGADTVGFKADLGAESTYAEDVNFYGNFDDAVTPNKLIVDSTAPTVEGGLNINIGDGSKYWNIRQVDATNYAGDLVVDATLGDDTIIGGSGSNTLWGGAGSDLIQGGSGSNYIKYYMGFDGNDEFTNLSAGDTIELNYVDFLRVRLDDASFASATTSSFDFKMTDGSSLKVSGDLADVTVRINAGGLSADYKVNANGGGFSTVNKDN